MIVYKSPFSSIECDKRLLSAVWFKASKDLDQEQVRSEISKILDYIKTNSITFHNC